MIVVSALRHNLLLKDRILTSLSWNNAGTDYVLPFTFNVLWDMRIATKALRIRPCSTSVGGGGWYVTFWQANSRPFSMFCQLFMVLFSSANSRKICRRIIYGRANRSRALGLPVVYVVSCRHIYVVWLVVGDPCVCVCGGGGGVGGGVIED